MSECEPTGAGGGDKDPPEYDATGARELWCASPEPTPAPDGLLDVVEDVADHLRNSLPIHPGSTLARALLAAYDAARGCGPCSDGECQTHPHNDHGDAAKAEPSVPLATIAAVADEYAKEQEAQRGKSIDPARGLARVEGARELVRRVSAGPVPEVLTKARVTEAVHVFTETGIHTRPARTSGMGVGGMEAMIEAENRRPARMTPPPTTPPLEPKSLRETSTVEGNLKPDSNSEPAVVWEGDGVRVTGVPGQECAEAWHGEWVSYSDPRVTALARALAEAKREVRKAAEDMRERAEALALEHKAGFLAEAIRAIPLPGDTDGR